MSQLAQHHGVLRFLTVAAGPVAVLDAGPAGPPVASALLIPGYTGSKEDFAPILDPLSTAGYRVVALDLPGQYQSPGPDRRDAYTIEWLGTVVNEVAAILSDEVAATLSDEVAATLGDVPIHLLGHSFGGLVGRAAVLTEPTRYQSLTLLCSGPAGIDGGRRERMAQLEPVATAGGLSALWAAMAEDLTVPPPVLEFLRTRFLAASLPGLFGMGDALLTEPDQVDKLRTTGVPALVCLGAADDAWPTAVQRDMATRLGAEFVVIDGAAHSPAVEQPTTTAAALTKFWAQPRGGCH